MKWKSSFTKKKQKIFIYLEKMKNRVKCYMKKAHIYWNNKANKEKQKIAYIIMIIAGIMIIPSAFTLAIKNERFVTDAKMFLNELGIYTEELAILEFESDQYGEQGTWRVKEKAEWIDRNYIQLTYNIDSIEKSEYLYKDIIYIIDNSGSMQEEKLPDLKYDLKNHANKVLEESNNRIAIITFNSTATLVQGFTNQKSTITSKISNIEATGETNYDAALQELDSLMSEYERKDDTDVIAIFITDGRPNRGNPNQIATYEMIKEKYPYLTLNGIQYYIGSKILDDLKKITDFQWSTYGIVDFSNVLKEASISRYQFSSFNIESEIDNTFFSIESKKNIEISKGTINLQNKNNSQIISWNLDNDNYIAGGTIIMKVKIKLKDEYIGEEGYYPVELKRKINSQLQREEEKITNNNNKIVVKNTHTVKYENNAPDGCVLETINAEKHYVMEAVTLNQSQPSCEGYLFQGWEIIDPNDAKTMIINNDTFQMPGNDLIIRGTWSKPTIYKRMNGSVNESATLYKVLESEAKYNGFAKKYTENHQDMLDGSGDKDIYYFHARNDDEGLQVRNMNNVIFGGICWQMIRTTDSGGVRLMYNGVPENRKCLDNRKQHVGYTSGGTISGGISMDYYSDSYTYNPDTKKFALSGNIRGRTRCGSDYCPIDSTYVGYYTCGSSSTTATCSELKQLTKYIQDNKFNYRLVVSTIPNSVVSIDTYNEYDENSVYDLGEIGYMGNNAYPSYTKNFFTTERMLTTITLSTAYSYGTNITYSNENKKYSLEDSFVLLNENYEDLKGKYTLQNRSETATSNNAYYIVEVNENTGYAIQLKEGKTISNIDSYIFGNDYTKVGNNYIINNPTRISASDWYSRYKEFKEMYVCKNPENNSCSEIGYTISTMRTGFTYANVKNETIKFSEKVRFENGKYILDEETSIITYKMDNLKKQHYTCWNESSQCDVVAYITDDRRTVDNFEESNTIKYTFHYFELKNGKDIDDVAYKSLNSDDINQIDSKAKIIVEDWYEKNMADYSEYLEDSIYCNDRVVEEQGVLNSSNYINAMIQFKNSRKLIKINNSYVTTNDNTDLSCQNETDKFCTANEKAKLKFKVGLITLPEINLLGNKNIYKGDSHYWTISPAEYFVSENEQVVINKDGSTMFYGHTISNVGFRPVITLRKEIEYSEGEGSMDNPYVINTP